MDQGLSCGCGASDEHGLFTAMQFSDSETVQALLEGDPTLIHNITVYDRHSAFLIAAANGQIEIVSMLLDRSLDLDILNRYKQEPAGDDPVEAASSAHVSSAN